MVPSKEGFKDPVLPIQSTKTRMIMLACWLVTVTARPSWKESLGLTTMQSQKRCISWP